MTHPAISTLIATNLEWLKQALDLLNQISDEAFNTSPVSMTPHRVSSHLRHVLEFYECFFDGAPKGAVDYDARRRDEAVERSRQYAAARIRLLMGWFEASAWPECETVLVRMEGRSGESMLQSSVARELQALSSHTIHHFALIAMTLRGHGIVLHPDFGTSPSTLLYRASLAEAAA